MSLLLFVKEMKNAKLCKKIIFTAIPSVSFTESLISSPPKEFIRINSVEEIAGFIDAEEYANLSINIVLPDVNSAESVRALLPQASPKPNKFKETPP